MNRILIAEDEARLAAFIEKGLRKYGFETTVASDGLEALQAAENEEFQLLLLDLGLPIKDGWTVLQELRSGGSNFPIIILTALTDDRNQATAMNLGANDYVTKPFRFGDLLEKIKSYIKPVSVQEKI
jgi:two-component system, OmpR family, copper resistance phosphate regulon response regulator CusR